MAEKVKQFTVVQIDDSITVIDSGQIGPPGPIGPPGKSGGSVFVLDVIPSSSGVVGNKTHPATVPANIVVSSCVSDTKNIRVLVGVEGGSDNYSPMVDVSGVPVVLTESSTKRWFTGYADIVVGDGTTQVEVSSDTGSLATVAVTLAGRGPNVLAASFGPYPGSQTALKAGDTIGITLSLEQDAVEVMLLPSGASSVSRNILVSGGSALISLVVGGVTTDAGFSFKARNALGTYGEVFTTAPVSIDQTYPSFSTASVQYPSGHNALGAGEQATVTCTVSGASDVSYAGVALTIGSPSTYSANKTVVNTGAGYVDTGGNYTITARRSSNGAYAVKDVTVNIATVAPTASIGIYPTGRLAGSPTGTSYEVRVSPNQKLLSAPTLNASLGAWAGSWVDTGTYWKRNLVISDSTSKGTGVFSSLGMVGLSGIPGNTITSGDQYTVGGFSSRTVTFPSFSRVAPIGASVADATKMTAQIAGGNTLTRYTDNAVHTNGFYPANADGSYNATGAYLGLSDSVFAGSNTSGTLQAIVQEAA